MDFVTVQKARESIEKEIFSTQVINKPLVESLYSYTARNINAPLDVPHFDNSAMDGYAFAFHDYQVEKSLKVVYTIQAGDTQLPVLQSGEAARIFTGAPIPEGADTVIMQEKVTEKEGKLLFQESEVIKGMNVRLQGSQTEKGELLVSENTCINSGIIGLLAGFGYTHIPVYSSPKVGIIVTGNELVESGKSLQFGQIYESNSLTLQSVLQELHIESLPPVRVADDKESTFRAIDNLLDKVDIMLITGGISVGEYDFVKESLERAGVEKLFYKIQQKPGKPLFFGKKEKHYVFALPGNPASVLTCFYQYVRPFLEGLKGNTDFYKEKEEKSLAFAFEKKNALTIFLKGYYREGEVEILSSQESYKMDSFAQANCLVELSGEPRIFQKGEKVILWKI